MAQWTHEQDAMSITRNDAAERAAVRPGCILAVGLSAYYIIVEHLGDDRWVALPLTMHNIKCFIGTTSAQREELNLAELHDLHVLPHTGVGPQHLRRGNEEV